MVVLNTAIGSAVFSTLSDSSEGTTWVTIIAGVLSILNAVIMTSVKATLNYEKKSELHRITSLRYRKLWVRFDDIHYALGVPYSTKTRIYSAERRRMHGQNGSKTISMLWKWLLLLMMAFMIAMPKSLSSQLLLI